MQQLRELLLSAPGWTFSIDQLLSPLVPPSPLHRLPYPIAHFLGYRAQAPTPAGTIVVVFWSLVGVFCGVTIVELVSAHVWTFRAPDNGLPVMIASFGASAVLEFCAIQSPLAQPRNAVGGQLLSSVVGVGVGRLFASFTLLSSRRWLGGATSCALATIVMVLMDMVHPPAGATAMIAVMDDRVAALGWRLVPSILLGTVLMQCVALLLNNVQRRFPIYWWSPEEVGHLWKRSERQQQQQQQQKQQRQWQQHREGASFRNKGDNFRKEKPGAGSYLDPSYAENEAIVEVAMSEFASSFSIVITRENVIFPPSIYIRPEEKALLENLSYRL